MDKKHRKKTTEIGSQVISIALIKYVFLGVLFISPLLRGLFFEEQFFVVSFISGFIIFLYLWKDHRITLDKLDLLFLALAACYAISMVGAATLRGAFLGFIRSVFYFLSFYFVRNSFITEKDKSQLSICFISAISTMTILTILTKAKVISLSNTIIGERFAGTVEYANTYAVLLAAVLVLLFTVSGSSYLSDKKLRKWVSLLSYINATALYATLSRGGILIYLLMLTIVFILTKEKIRFLANLIIVNTLAVASSVFILRDEGIVVLAIILCGGFLVFGLQQIHERIPIKALKVSGGVISLLTIAVIVIKTPLNRLLDLNFSSSGFYVRFVFYRDAIKIFLDNWLFGTGSAGWEILYGQYQSYYYISKLVHSSLVQSMVEVGLVGISLSLAIVVFVVSKYIRSSGKKLLDQAFLLVFLTIFLHSLIDFDLSVPAVAMMMYIFMGAIVGQSMGVLKNTYTKIGIGVACFVILISVTCMGLAGFSVKKVLQNGTVTDFTAFKETVTTATKMDPLNKDYYTYLGQAYLAEAEQTENQSLIEKSLREYDRAIELEPQNYLTHLAKGIALQKIGRYEEASLEYNQVIKLRPFHGQGYEYAMKNHFEQAQKNKDLNALNSIIKLYDEALKQMSEVSESELNYIDIRDQLPNLPLLNNYTGMAWSLLGNYPQAFDHFSLAIKYANGEIRQQTEAWLLAVQWKLNRQVDLSTKAQEALDLIDSFGKQDY